MATGNHGCNPMMSMNYCKGSFAGNHRCTLTLRIHSRKSGPQTGYHPGRNTVGSQCDNRCHLSCNMMVGYHCGKGLSAHNGAGTLCTRLDMAPVSAHNGAGTLCTHLDMAAAPADDNWVACPLIHPDTLADNNWVACPLTLLNTSGAPADDNWVVSPLTLPHTSGAPADDNWVASLLTLLNTSGAPADDNWVACPLTLPHLAGLLDSRCWRRLLDVHRR